MRTDLKTLDELSYEPAPWYAQAAVLIAGAIVGLVVMWQIIQMCRPSQVEDMSPSEAVQAIHERPDYPGLPQAPEVGNATRPDYPGQNISGGGRTFSPAKPADLDSLGAPPQAKAPGEPSRLRWAYPRERGERDFTAEPSGSASTSQNKPADLAREVKR